VVGRSLLIQGNSMIFVSLRSDIRYYSPGQLANFESKRPDKAGWGRGKLGADVMKYRLAAGGSRAVLRDNKHPQKNWISHPLK